MFEKIKKLFTKKPVEAAPPREKSKKEIATERGDPYVDILSMELDENNMGIGSFELDWNDKFVANLVRAGYQKNEKDTDADIVDRWFTDICRNVVLETWEQYEAMTDVNDGRVIKSRNIGDGRSEVS